MLPVNTMGLLSMAEMPRLAPLSLEEMAAPSPPPRQPVT
jgi:hypothetical protein